MSNEQQRILARVRKMMNLANDAGATAGERDNALRMAHATLAKYNLDIAQMEANEVQGKNKDEPREQLDKVFHGTVWTRRCCMAIGQLFFCSYFYQRLGANTDNAKHTFVGRHSNVVTAQAIAEFVVQSIHDEAKKHMRSRGANYAIYRAFAQAATEQVLYRCYVLRQESEKQTADVAAKVPGTALVLASLYAKEQSENSKFIEQGLGIMLRTRKQTTREVDDYEARSAGMKHGANVSLNKQIGGA